MYDEDDYKGMIIDSLLENGLINDEIYDKCSKPHISGLPHDLRTNDTAKLQQRKDSAKKKLKDNNDKLDKLSNEQKKLSRKMSDNKKWAKESFEDLGKQIRNFDEKFYDGHDFDDDYDTWQNWGIGSEYGRINENFDEFKHIIRGIDNDLGRYFDGNLKRVSGFNKGLKYAKQILKDVKTASKTQLVPDSWVKNAQNLVDYLTYTQNYYKRHDKNRKKYESLGVEEEKLNIIISDLENEISKIDSKLK